MTKQINEPLGFTPAIRQILVAEADIAAAERLLSVIAAAPSAHPAQEGLEAVDRHDLLAQAASMLALRERRLRTFEARFSADAPFALLLALYVHENREPDITITRLCRLAWIGHSKALRWIELLVDQGWIERRDDRHDKRKALISLCSKGRKALDELFSGTDGFEQAL